MKKKDYQKPATKVVQLQHRGMLMASGQVQATMSGTFTETDGWDEDVSSARAQGNNAGWDEDEE